MSTDLQDLEQQKALDHVRELMSAHWREAQDAQDEDGKFGIAFKATFDRGASPTKLKVTCRIAKTISDEIERIIAFIRTAGVKSV